MDSFLRKKAKEYQMKKENGYSVYVIKSNDYFYYGITSNCSSRAFSHYSQIYYAVLTGDYKKPISETKMLRLHKVIANNIIPKRLSKYTHPLDLVKKYRLNFTVVCVCETKLEALDVETILIKAAKQNKNCLNTAKRCKL